jgi:hypothetical protein
VQFKETARLGWVSPEIWRLPTGTGQRPSRGSARLKKSSCRTLTAASRNSVRYQKFLDRAQKASLRRKSVIITDNLSSRNSVSTRDWLAGRRPPGSWYSSAAFGP